MLKRFKSTDCVSVVFLSPLSIPGCDSECIFAGGDQDWIIFSALYCSAYHVLVGGGGGGGGVVGGRSSRSSSGGGGSGRSSDCVVLFYKIRIVSFRVVRMPCS